MVNRISAQIIADSKNIFGERITTFVLTFPRIVLAEFNTHRMLSKNSASSRAIPFKTMLKKVQEEPFVPIAWQKDHKGMQGTEYITSPDEIQPRINDWLDARNDVVARASYLHEMGVTKQLCNRLLEPFLMHTVICTGTEWENFFALRAHPAAEIHIADLAQKMLVAYNESEPKLLQPGEWHIPFGDTFDLKRLMELYVQLNNIEGETWVDTKELEALKLKIAMARCARISYNNFEGKDDYLADIKLFDTLVGAGHMSPTEHAARAMSTAERHLNISGKIQVSMDEHDFDTEAPESIKGWSGNFKGFIQFRKLLQGENQKDNRVIKK